MTAFLPPEEPYYYPQNEANYKPDSQCNSRPSKPANNIVEPLTRCFLHFEWFQSLMFSVCNSQLGRRMTASPKLLKIVGFEK